MDEGEEAGSDEAALDRALADAISRAGYCAEWALLFTGLLLLMKI